MTIAQARKTKAYEVLREESRKQVSNAYAVFCGVSDILERERGKKHPMYDLEELKNDVERSLDFYVHFAVMHERLFNELGRCDKPEMKVTYEEGA